MKGTLHHAGTRHTLRFERRLAHSPEKVWRALTEASELAHWFPAEIHGPREQGSALRFVFPTIHRKRRSREPRRRWMAQ